MFGVRCQRERSQGYQPFHRTPIARPKNSKRVLHGKTRHEVKAEHLREEKERRRGSRKKDGSDGPDGDGRGATGFGNAERVRSWRSAMSRVLSCGLSPQ